MTLKQELEGDISKIFKSKWETREGVVVPADTSLKLSNDAIKLKATVLYADMADSTKLVDGQSALFAAEVFKAFLHCAAKVIRSESGTITAYDGDRIMAVFMGEIKNTPAVRAALKINYAVQRIINPAMKAQYPNNSYTLKHVCGIDTSDLVVARTGVRGANDLVWVGRAANYAAKLSSLPDVHPTYISTEVYNSMVDDVKVSSGKSMWESVSWKSFDNRTIHRSNWWWRID